MHTWPGSLRFYLFIYLLCYFALICMNCAIQGKFGPSRAREMCEHWQTSQLANVSLVYSGEANKTSLLLQYCFSICIQSSKWVKKLHLTHTWGPVPASWCVTSSLEHYWLQKHVAHLSYDYMSQITLAPYHKHFRPSIPSEQIRTMIYLSWWLWWIWLWWMNLSGRWRDESS